MQRLLALIILAVLPNLVAAENPERIALWNNHAPIGDGKFAAEETWITVHRPANPNGAAVVICPGGGYGGLVTGAEGHGIAKWLNGHGITGVVLEYRLPKGRAYVPLLDAQQALRTVRAKAKDWRLKTDRVGIMGFSAGGHLAATAGTHFDDDSRPDFMILVYPVITMSSQGHSGSRDRLLGKGASQELLDLFSNEKQVTTKTPPAYLAHAVDDRPVPPENSRMFHAALKARGVPSEYLELPDGGHGLNGYQGASWDAWQSGSIKWLARLGFIPKDDWVSLFDGQTFNGWKASENKDSWQIIDGVLAAKGQRSHLFYDGKISQHRFKNFELSVDVKAEGNANAGIYFHTEYQEKGWPTKGFEFQIINSSFRAYETKNDYVERKKTGSLYGVRNLGKSPVANNEWFNYRINVQGKTIRGYVNGRLLVDYTEPEDPFTTKPGYRVLDDGTFAFQCHDPHSVVLFKNIKVRLLPDDAATPGHPPADSEYERRLRAFGKSLNLPIADFHVHLAGGLNAEQLMKHARKHGFTYGIVLPVGAKTRLKNEAALNRMLQRFQPPPETYLGLQVDARGWTKTFSETARKRFDYVIADDTAWANRTRTIANREKFMDELVERMVQIISREPIDILSQAGGLPRSLRADYDSLWTDERMAKVIKALAENDVAMEINARRQIPSARFIRQAKAAGVKFAFGTDNTGAKDLGRLDYCLRMAVECRLQRKDFWFPK